MRQDRRTARGEEEEDGGVHALINYRNYQTPARRLDGTLRAALKIVSAAKQAIFEVAEQEYTGGRCRLV